MSTIFEDIIKEGAGGATGEPETEAASSRTDSTDEALGALEKKTEGAPEFDDAFFEKVSKLDPDKLPADFRKKLELPFLQMTSRKINEEVAKREAIYAGMIDKLTKQGVKPTDDERSELMDRAKSGDGEATMALVERMVAERVGPIEGQLAAQRAVEQAYAMNPLVKEREPQIEEFLASSPDAPVLRQIMLASGHRATPLILSGIANTLELQRLQGEMTKRIADAEKAAVEKYKNEVRSAPATTSRAGTVSSAPINGTMDTRSRFLKELRDSGIEPSADLLRKLG